MNIIYLFFRITVPEDTPIGATLTYIRHLQDTHNIHSHFVILEGHNQFEIVNPSGALIILESMDRELKASYNLTVSDRNGIYSLNASTFNIFIEVADVNDNSPIFSQDNYEETISEGAAVGYSVKQVSATDNDLHGTPNAAIFYEIMSGNDKEMFTINKNSGIVTVNGILDYDKGPDQYQLIINACDKGTPMRCSFVKLHINIADQNDNGPQFPVVEYLQFVGENEPVGTPIFVAHATDADKGIYGKLNYSIINTLTSSYNIDDSWRFFHVDAITGLLSTNAVFDYEQRNHYSFFLRSNDIGGKAASIKIHVEIESRDEFYPYFTEKTYRFRLVAPPHGILPIGYFVGQVKAIDRDKGPDGCIVYQLTTQNIHFKINRTTGAIIIKRKFNIFELIQAEKEISFIVTASSGRQNSLTNNTVVEITLDLPVKLDTNTIINNANNATIAFTNSGLTNWALGLLIGLILLFVMSGSAFVFLHMKNKRNKIVNKPSLNSGSMPNSNNYVDPTAFDTIPIRATGAIVATNANQFGPPKYDEVPPYGRGHATSRNSGAATTSELSGSEQSGSSGRGSAEEGDDGEDEEIRMINEGPLQRECGMHQNNDGDNLSDVSVRNTQEYLARLGIVDSSNTGVHKKVSRICADPRGTSSKDAVHHHQSVPLDSLHMFDEESATDNDITTLIYAKLKDATGSDRISLADQTGGVNSGTLSSTMEHIIGIRGYNDVPVVTHQPSMNGSLSSIVHSEEELAGSYNWDYLLDWGPQYQPLAHVFSEIARLKDDASSVQSAASGNSSVKSKSSVAPVKNIPPPLITNVAPRSIAVPVLHSRGGSSHHTNNPNQIIMLPRSPINHDSSGDAFSTSAAMSPSFSPSLSPLATKSPSISPLVTPGLPATHHMMPRQAPQLRSKPLVETELRI